MEEKTKQLPFDPDNDESVAAWVDTHDLSEIEELLVDVDPKELGIVSGKMRLKRVSEKEATVIRTRWEEESSPDLRVFSVRMPEKDLDEIKKLAEETGVGPTTMARILIKEAMKARRRA
ncbi:MAG: hypothetical protein ACYCYO_20115 [Bacilli bacterium]